MLVFEKYFKETNNHSLSTLDYLKIGLFQSISMIPGVSRAMATIYGGRIVGLSKKEATEFSFLLAIPTMMAASALDLFKSRDILASQNLMTLITKISNLENYYVLYFPKRNTVEN